VEATCSSLGRVDRGNALQIGGTDARFPQPNQRCLREYEALSQIGAIAQEPGELPSYRDQFSLESPRATCPWRWIGPTVPRANQPRGNRCWAKGCCKLLLFGVAAGGWLRP